MKAVSLPSGQITQLTSTVYGPWVHIMNNAGSNAAIIYLCYDGSDQTLLSNATGLPVLPNTTYVIDQNPKETSIRPVYAFQNSGNPVDVRIQGA